MGKTTNSVQIGEAAAIYAFVAHLLTLDEPITLSRNHAVMGELGDLIAQFCKLHGWEIEDERWFEKLQTKSEA